MRAALGLCGLAARRSVRRRLCSTTPSSTTPSAAAESNAAPVSQAVSEVRIKARSLWESYSEQLTEHPIRTNAVTSGLLCTLGDGLAQAFEWRYGRYSCIEQLVRCHESASHTLLLTSRMWMNSPVLVVVAGSA